MNEANPDEICLESADAPPLRVPGSTYRVQMSRDFGFARLFDLIDYLDTLGVTDCYTSPIFGARHGSTHGYDVTDPTRLSDDLGRPEEFFALADELRARGMGLLVDFVPNHMCVAGSENNWWQDVLRNGTTSRYARWFDVYWDEAGRVHVPLLGVELEDAIEQGEITLGIDPGGYCLQYFDQRFPLGDAAESRVADLLLAREPDFLAKGGAGVEDALAELGTPHVLREVLSLARFRPEHFRSAARRPGYRRFFDINELVGLRIEEPEVFSAVHDKLLQLLSAGQITGIRVDHVDGLRFPRRYLDDLNAVCRSRTGSPAYVVVEKILERGETLPRSFGASGTTGYEFLNTVGGLFVDPDGAARIRRAYARFTGDALPFSEVQFEAKQHVLTTSLKGDAERLAQLAERLLPDERVSLRADLPEALVSVIAGLAVYRTYWEPDDERLSGPDERRLDDAVATARRERPRLTPAAFDFVRDAITGGVEATPADREELVLCFQQLTGPAAAKGVEDTALYRHVPLLCENEVGGAPDDAAVSVQQFHAFNQERRRLESHGLSTTSTHDTKRGEDARLRIAALSEAPDAWEAAIWRWRDLNARHSRRVAGARVPDPVEEYFIYQTLIGALPYAGPEEPAWPAFVERLSQYMQKALREAKRHTGWMDPDEEYERATEAFIRSILDPAVSAAFLDDLRAFHQGIEGASGLASLSQIVLKVASPGVPDFYQGSELWELGFVDPDNRRAVDFEGRRLLLRDVARWLSEDALAAWPRLWNERRNGALKLAATHSALSLRRKQKRLFQDGDYVPLPANGSCANRVVAFGRRLGGAAAVAIAGRWLHGLGPVQRPPVGSVWRDTSVAAEGLARGVYKDVFTGREFRLDEASEFRLARVFHRLPVALLERAA